jgi:Protein of unknown function (DUF3767)
MSDYNNPSDPRRNAIVTDNKNHDDIETAKWLRYLPESFGIRSAVGQSKYRWCVRESALWGLASGTAMSLHRLRMKSSITFSVNVGFATCYVVYLGSYYFCYKKRNYHEQMIELMMKLNTFDHASTMPAEIPLNEHHPFVIPKEFDNDEKTNDVPIPTRQYVAKLPERKEWQKQLPTQDAANVFQPLDESSKK